MYKYKQSLRQLTDSSGNLTDSSVKNPSKRWETTTASALSQTAAASKLIDRSSILDELRNRKVSNWNSSIHFGNNKVEYLSDTMDNQQRCNVTVDPVERDAQRVRNKNMKTELTTTNFSLGHDKPEYESLNHKAMAEACNFQFNGRMKLGTELMHQIKDSSISFGKEVTNYNTTAHDAMISHNNQANYEQSRSEIKKMKANLRKHNFSFGDDTVDYTSDYKRGYGNVELKSYKEAERTREEMHAIKRDIRATHWVFGHEKTSYLSDTHEALQAAERGSRAADIVSNAARAKVMKQQLQKTSYIIGTDDEYN